VQAFPKVVLQYGKTTQQQQQQQQHVPHSQYGGLATSNTGSNSHNNGQSNSDNTQLVADLLANANAASTTTAATNSSGGKIGIGSGSNKQVTFGPMPLPLPQQPPVIQPSSTVQSGPDNQTEAEVTRPLLTIRIYISLSM
jgi:hypothetical protein